MLSKSVLQIVGLGININCVLGYLPYYWDHRRMKMQKGESGFIKRRWLFQVVLVVVVAVFETCRCLQVILTTEKLVVRILFVVILTHNVFTTVAVYTVFSDFGLLHGVVNAFLEIRLKFQNMFPEESKKRKAKSLILILVFPFVWVGIVVFFLARLKVLLRNPNLAIFLSSVLGDGLLGSPKIVQHLLKWPNFYLCFSLYPLSAFFITTILSLVFITGPSLSLSDKRCKKFSATAFSKRIVELKVLQIYFNSMFTNWILGLECFYLVVLTLRLYVLVLNPRPSSTFGLAFPVLIFWVMFGQLAGIYEKSQSVLRSWAGTTRPNWFLKFLQSRTPLCVRLGTFFYIDNSLRLTVLSIVVTQAVSLIVASNHD